MSAARGRRLLCSLLVALLARGAAAAPAAAPTSREASGPIEPGEVVAPPPLAPGEDPLVRVGALINDGQSLFDTADYTGAIDRWTQAYALLPDAPDIAATRNLLAYQIAQAYIEAHAVEPQPSHLRKAERLLEQYIAGLDASEVESRAAAEQMRAKIQAELAAAELAAAERPRPEIAPAPATQPAATSAGPVPKDSKRRNPLMIGGGVALGLGGALLVGTAVAAAAGSRVDADGEQAVADGASAAELDDLLARGNRANNATIATAVVGGALVVVGAALMITGRVRKRAVAAAPSFGPGFVGLGLQGRF